MNKILYILALAVMVFASCSDDKINRDVMEIKEIGELSTAEYTIGKVVKVDDSEFDIVKSWNEMDTIIDLLKDGFKYGDRKLLISVKVKVKAGIDLNKVSDKDIKVEGNAIEITLPEAEITSFTMDPKHVNIELESTTGFRDKFTQSEKMDFLQQAEASIREDMKNTEILKDAKENAELFIQDFYKRLGYEKVTVKHKGG